MNLLQNLQPEDLGPLSWDNAPLRWEPLPRGGLRIYAPAQADYFQDPSGVHVYDTAPFLWLPVTGNFVAQLHVRPTFGSTYDSGCLMARHNEQRWAKLCYERTDFGTEAIVSVVTDSVSDDANGVNLTVPDVWLQLVRVGNVFGLHYALPASGPSSAAGTYQMVRYFRLDVPPTIKVGLVAQCPAGEGSVIEFLSLNIEPRTVQNLRAGV